MTSAKILIIGYGVGEERPEAVSVNAWHTKRDLKRMGIKAELLSVGFVDKSNDGMYGKSIIEAITHRRQIIDNISSYIREHKITHVVDMFVMPLVSSIVTQAIKNANPSIVYIKELHNAPGYPNYLSYETLVRIVGNSSLQVNKLFHIFDRTYTRNYFLAEKYKEHHILYLPASVRTYKARPYRPAHKLRVCYLGHPLKKKGIAVFPQLFKTLRMHNMDNVEFTFAFSNIGPRTEWEETIASAGQEFGYKCIFAGQVVPAEFFRTQDVYVLPIIDIYGAVSTPNTVLESMEAGCVVVTTNIPSLVGIISPNNSIPVEESTENLIARAIMRLENNTIRRKLTIQARKDIMAKYTNDKVEKALKEIYA